MKPVSEAEGATLRAVDTLTDIYGYPPTVREIATFTRRSPSTTQATIQRLTKKGKIERTPGRTRSIKVVA